MNWDAIGAIGQILGSAGVLISVAYLAIQVGHARDAIARSARQARADANIQLWLARASDESSRRVAKMNSAVINPFVAAVMEQTGATAEEAYAEYFHQFAWWSSREHSLSSVDQVSAGERAAIEGGARYVYGTLPISRLWYETVKVQNLLNPETVRHVNTLLAQPA